MKIEKFDKKILEDIENIEKESFNEPWLKEVYMKLIEKDNVFVYGAKADNRLVGFILIMDMIDVLEVIRIAIKKEYRRQGMGEDILREFISDSDKDIFLEVRTSNEKAIKLYKKIGFELLNIRKNYYKDTNESALIFRFQKGG